MENNLKFCKHGFNIYCEMLAAPTGFWIEHGENYSYVTGKVTSPTMVIFNVTVQENHHKFAVNLAQLIESGKVSNHYELVKDDVLFSALKEKGFIIYQNDSMMIMDITKYMPDISLDDKMSVSVVRDLDSLKHWVKINQAYWGYLYSEEQWAEIHALDNVAMYLAYCDGIPASSMLTITDSSACIELLHTLDNQRKKGLATAMIKKALSDLKSKGITKITVQTGAVELFKRIGFSVVCEKYVARYNTKS